VKTKTFSYSPAKVRRYLLFLLTVYSVLVVLYCTFGLRLSKDTCFFMGLWGGVPLGVWGLASGLFIWERGKIPLTGTDGLLAMIFLPLFFMSVPLIAGGIYYGSARALAYALVLLVLSEAFLFRLGGRR
jgi:hypothetical protein